jgi:FecR protein/Putative zinc-finger
MFRKHVIRNLSAYHHGELPHGQRLQIEEHLQTCTKCRAAHEEIRFGARLASVLERSAGPELLWNSLPEGRQLSARGRWAPVILLGSLAAMLLLVMFFAWIHVPAGASWLVKGLPGTSKLHPAEVLQTDASSEAEVPWLVKGLPGTSKLHPGEVLQTDASSEAEVQIANIGQLLINPNTRIRLLVTSPDEHRIALDRGKVEARTWAPPRLFIVETPSASAVDLGCRYTLEVQEDGSSLLHVTLGLVALEHNGRETIVPAGAFCRTRRAAGPGTPFFEDSSAELQSALGKVDSLTQGPERTQQFEIVLREAHARDALSLWFLLPNLDASSRGLVYDRLAQLLPPPKEVTREGIVALDPKMLDAWKKVVSQLWQQ